MALTASAVAESPLATQTRFRSASPIAAHAERSALSQAAPVRPLRPSFPQPTPYIRQPPIPQVHRRRRLSAISTKRIETPSATAAQGQYYPATEQEPLTNPRLQARTAPLRPDASAISGTPRNSLPSMPTHSEMYYARRTKTQSPNPTLSSSSGSLVALTSRAFTHACAVLQIECSIHQRDV